MFSSLREKFEAVLRHCQSGVSNIEYLQKEVKEAKITSLKIVEYLASYNDYDSIKLVEILGDVGQSLELWLEHFNRVKNSLDKEQMKALRQFLANLKRVLEEEVSVPSEEIRLGQAIVILGELKDILVSNSGVEDLSNLTNAFPIIERWISDGENERAHEFIRKFTSRVLDDLNREIGDDRENVPEWKVNAFDKCRECINILVE